MDPTLNGLLEMAAGCASETPLLELPRLGSCLAMSELGKTNPRLPQKYIESRVVCEEDRFVTHIKYELPDGEVFQTGYGVLGRQNQTTDQVSALLEETGFELEAIEDHEFWFRLEARKPIG
jgi:hypothetical protein